MKDLKIFLNFIKSAHAEVYANKKTYLGAIISLIVLGNVETLFPFLGVAPESNVFIFLTIASTLATFMIISQVVLIQKKRHGGTGELRYFVPTFLLYSLYYSFLFFIGILFLVLPGLYVLIFYSMVPFVAVLDDECQGSFFKKSVSLVKKNIALVAWASVFNLILELSAFLTSPIENPMTRAIVTLIYSVPDAVFTMLLTIATVKIYYYLKAAPEVVLQKVP